MRAAFYKACVAERPIPVDYRGAWISQDCRAEQDFTQIDVGPGGWNQNVQVGGRSSDIRGDDDWNLAGTRLRA